jgi:hypothetical protein
VIREAKSLSPQAQSLTEVLNTAVYQISFEYGVGSTKTDDFRTPNSPYPPDILDFKEIGEGVEMTLRIGEGVKVGPRKVIQELFGLSQNEVQQSRIERKGLFVREGDQWAKP